MPRSTRPPRLLEPDDIAPLAAGAAVFGTGGGGAVHTVQLSVRAAVAEHGPVPLVRVADLTDDDVVINMSAMGAPSVGIEMLGAAAQAETLVREVEQLVGRPVTTLMAAEIGGSNGVAPVGWAAALGLQVLDADGMGRAFPQATMIAMNVAGLPSEFAVMADVVGNVTVLRTVDIAWLERHARAFTVAAGGIALGAHYLLTRATAPGAVIEGTVSRAVEVGRCLLGAADPVAAVAEELGAAVLVAGKVVDIDRVTEGGFTRGSVTVQGVGADRGRLLRVEIQNENLVVIEDGVVLVSVPDLVTIVDSETGEAISTELLRFGQRVSVLAWACDPLWRSPRGIELAGPRAFGYDLDYAPFDGRQGGDGVTAGRAPGALSVGIDVGGTNTDAVVLDDAGTVLAWTKQATTDDVTGGVRAALAAVLRDLGPRRDEVSRVMLGTTHATNAIVRRRDLGRVAVVRLGAPATTDYPSLAGWPADLRDTVLAGALLAGGGHLVDGYPLSPLDPDGVRRFLDGLAGGFDAVAVCGIFSPSFPEQELEIAALVADHVGADLPVSLSHEVGELGLLERENATVLNAALHRVAGEVTDALLVAVADEQLDAATFFAQNDGTLMAVEYAARYPVLTIGSGPANSIRGAARLSGADAAVVVDVGGTTSDLGVLVDRFPRESTLPREIGGVRTNFRMPDVLSLALGGGTVVDLVHGVPLTDSVGHRIRTEGLLFGGGTATLTDAAAAVRPGTVDGRGLPPLDRGTREALAAALATAHDRIESAVERMSLGRTDLPLVVVGGGAFLVPDVVAGAGEVLRPERGNVANAVGAAIALAGGRADQLCDHADRAEAIAAAGRQAVERAIQAGADPRTVEVVDVLETPVSYATRPTLKVAVKAAGPLARLTPPLSA